MSENEDSGAYQMHQQLRIDSQFPQLGPVSRNKTWDEIGVEEQIQRLRQTLRAKEFAINELREQVAALMQHQHGRNGELLRPIYGGGMQGTIGHGYDPLA